MTDVHQLPPEDPRRAEFVLGYIEGGACCGLGPFEFDTIKAALRAVGPQRHALAGLLEIEDLRIASGAFTPNAAATARIEAARLCLTHSAGLKDSP